MQRKTGKSFAVSGSIRNFASTFTYATERQKGSRRVVPLSTSGPNPPKPRFVVDWRSGAEVLLNLAAVDKCWWSLIPYISGKCLQMSSGCACWFSHVLSNVAATQPLGDTCQSKNLHAKGRGFGCFKSLIFKILIPTFYSFYSTCNLAFCAEVSSTSQSASFCIHLKSSSV